MRGVNESRIARSLHDVPGGQGLKSLKIIILKESLVYITGSYILERTNLPIGILHFQRSRNPLGP